MLLAIDSLTDQDISASPNDLTAIKQIAEIYGFCLVKSAFTQSEMQNLYENMHNTQNDFAGNDLPDLLSCPRLRSLLKDDRVIGPAQVLLGPQLVYYAETAISFEEKIGPLTLNPYRPLHRDAFGTPHGLDHPWRPDPLKPKALYPSYRFAIYLQDYREYSGGLKVIPGSHIADKDYLGSIPTGKYWQPISKRLQVKCFERDFPLFNIPNQPGDLVIWNLNTFHSAGAVRLKLDRRIALMPDTESQLLSDHTDVICDSPGPRNAIFFDYGAPAQETDLYLKSRAISRNQAHQRLDRSAGSKYPPPLHDYWVYDDPAQASDLQALGVQLRFDSLIVSLSFFLVEQLALHKGDINCLFSPEIRPYAERLLSICSRHTEYSPHFRLVDVEKLKGVAHTPTLALQSILVGIKNLGII